MLHSAHDFSLLVLVVGLVIIFTLLLKAGLKRLHIPGLVGFMALGFVLRIADSHCGLLPEGAYTVFEFLARVGVIALLFRIGLESNLHGLLRQLPRAGGIWIGNVVLSGAAGYGVARWWLGFDVIPSAFAAVSLTATSVGVSMAVWREKKALQSPNGELLVDVAELDDISGVGLMALLFAVVPTVHGGATGDSGILADMAQTGAWFLLKLALFVAGCLLFSRYVEERLTRFFSKVGPRQTRMLLVVGTGFVIAALAGWLGFSLAIGALFAGLLFSRDPDAVKFDASFESIYELFTPFFFVGIGLGLRPEALTAGLAVGAVLLVGAVLGKLLGAGLPALYSTSGTGALLMGLSMTPRAEIAMIIIQRGETLGTWAVPPRLYAGLVLVSAATCVVIPWLLSSLLDRRPQRE